MMNTSYKYLLFIILVLWPFNSALSSVEKCHPDDKRALLQIKSVFNNVSYFSTWLPHTDCCKWNAVQCKLFHKTNTFRINFLTIFDSDEVVGEIPEVVTGLTYLEVLVLSNLPNLSGPIPHFFGRLSHIYTLELDTNRLTGSIPAYLGQLPKIKRINLGNNQLTGRIPDSLGSLMFNSLLFLNDNRLSGPIPRSLGRVNFLILELGGNQLVGDASFLFEGDKSNLAHLNVSHNRLSFDFTNVVMPVAEINSSLLILDMSHNSIYGQLPAWLGQASVMYQFDVSYNRLCGPIPTTGGKLQGFDPSFFSHNRCLCGAPLPPCKS